MSPAALTQQQLATFRQVFDALFDLLQWTYGVAPAGPERARVETEIATAWSHPDGSVSELMAYLGGLHSTVFGEPPARRDRYRSQVRRIFGSLFAAADPTERGRVLALLHGVLERLSPGCTGVAAPPQPAAAPAAAPTPPAAAYGGPSAAPYAPVPAAAAGGAASQPTPPELADLLRKREEVARCQALQMDQEIWNMRSQLAGKVIDSMGR